jgi:hypothetical protein
MYLFVFFGITTSNYKCFVGGGIMSDCLSFLSISQLQQKLFFAQANSIKFVHDAFSLQTSILRENAC